MNICNYQLYKSVSSYNLVFLYITAMNFVRKICNLIQPYCQLLCKDQFIKNIYMQYLYNNKQQTTSKYQQHYFIHITTNNKL